MNDQSGFRPMAWHLGFPVLAFIATFFSLFVFQSPLTGTDSAFAQSSVRPPANATTSAAPRAGTSTSIPGVKSVAPEDPKKGNVPGGSLGNRSQSDFWRALRQGATGTVSIPDKKAGQAIRGTPQRLRTEADVRKAQAAKAVGEGTGDATPQGTQAVASNPIVSWVQFRQGPLATNGAYALGGMILLLFIFFLVRGRIRVEHGLSGQLISRFGSIERLGHWLLA
ncbi:MAG: hypothetical protein ACR2OV_15270, partial [Hyphomicrobiaceae bacterium]